MPYQLDITVPVNGRFRAATVTVLDEGKVKLTDKADLVSAAERRRLAKRLAERLKTDPAGLEEKLEAAWSEQVERRRQHEQAEGAGPPPRGLPAPAGEDVRLSELGNARRLVRHFGRDFRHCHVWKRDLVWDGKRWREDDTGQAERWAKEVPRLLYQEAAQADDEGLRQALVQHGLHSEQAKVVRAALALARSEPGVPVLPAELDRDPMLLNCPNGVLNLRTGQLREHHREDLITKLCPVVFDPAAKCPFWEATLKTVFPDDQPVIRYVQKLLGYALTGETREQLLAVFWGTGANGKSTLINMVLELMGKDYAIKASRDLFMARKQDNHPAQLARLFGKRLVVAVETQEGARLDEALVKELTGGDPITARRMREDPWQFAPTHKAVLVTNHKPEIRGTDHGIWRRIRLVPFTVRIPDEEQDKRLPEKLRDELPGILAWCVRGCLAWQEEGLEPPDEVKAATKTYRDEQDVIGEFLADHCNRHPELKVRASVLYAAFKAWCERSGEKWVSQRCFGEAMTERKIERRESHGYWYLGIALRPPPEDQRE
jgi:putative DNA primase/helicase